LELDAGLLRSFFEARSTAHMNRLQSSMSSSMYRPHELAAKKEQEAVAVASDSGDEYKEVEALHHRAKADGGNEKVNEG
jgi:hypothetical protein